MTIGMNGVPSAIGELATAIRHKEHKHHENSYSYAMAKKPPWLSRYR